LALRRWCSSSRPSLADPHLALALAHQAIGMAVLAVATLQARRLVQDVITN
jgi:cytochrome c oxidase assembly protein subunit 15